MTRYRDKYSYFGEVSIDYTRTPFFFGQLKNPEAASSYVGNVFTHRFIKYKISTMSGSGKYNPNCLMNKTIITQHHHPLKMEFLVMSILEFLRLLYI